MLCFLLPQVRSQDDGLAPTVLACAGASFQNSGSGHQPDWTLGEMAIEGYSHSGHFLSQGFHQPNLDFVDATIEVNGLAFEVGVYPNPTSEVLFLKTDSPTPLTFEMVDATGRVFHSESLSSSETSWKLGSTPNALYFLRVTSHDGQLLKTFKIIKTN